MNKEYHTKFLEKEKDAESGDCNLGVRQYGDGVGRFFCPDKMWEKYYSLSPYVYCGNNPVGASDPSGLELQLSGSQENVDQTLALIGNGTGNFYSASVSTEGNVQLNPTNMVGPPSLAQKSFKDDVQSIIANPKTVSVGVVKGSEEVIIGSSYLKQIDIGDIATYNNGAVVNSAAILDHELSEQALMQIGNVPQEQAHLISLGIESRVSGSRLLSQTDPTPFIVGTLNGSSLITGQIQFTYDKGIIITTLNKNNIIKNEQIQK
ncbi:MAG: hypothetical protein NT007_02765 [Candidatus Kapabacteria bacterium]|nr:hypothetical protein [Candidatus Kapabacteria bacterium]